MEIKTYRAATLQDALQLVRQELGPDAAVLRAREVAGSLWQRLRGQWQIEVTAATDVAVPPRLPRESVASPSTATAVVETPIVSPPIISDPTAFDRTASDHSDSARTASPRTASTSAGDSLSAGPRTDHSGHHARNPCDAAPAAWSDNSSSRDSSGACPAPSGHSSGATARSPETRTSNQRSFPRSLRFSGSHPAPTITATRPWPLLEELSRRPSPGPRMPASVFDLFVDLLDADLGDELARELIEEARGPAGDSRGEDAATLQPRLIEVLQSRIAAAGPIVCEPGQRRIAALVGPTGVGKTTTLAKLAANFRLRERRRVGLVTVDTYRIAAVEQLRTYAEIIDLPMEVVATPGDMRRALDRLSDVELVLLDTAGRSPRDELRIQELKSILEEARADEVHLVLSAASGSGPLQLAAERFAPAGVTSVLLTKLDEAATLGPAFALLQRTGRRLSYLTHGQNVPDDIEVADARLFARRLLSGNIESSAATLAGEVSKA